MGSIGRGTAIGTISDVDMVYALPWGVYDTYDDDFANGQRALLRDVRDAIRTTYPSSDVGIGGRVVAVEFTDGMTIEVVPGFRNGHDGSFDAPDSTGGGSWKHIDPLAEIDEIDTQDVLYNGNLKPLCRMIRAWREECLVDIKGILIDTPAYQFIENWEYKDKSFLYYDFMSRDFFDVLRSQDRSQQYWLAPGSGARVYRTGSFEGDAADAFAKAEEAIIDLNRGLHFVASSEWRAIYGPQFPDIGK